MAHEMERKLQAGEDEGNYLTLSMKKGGVEIEIPVVLKAVKLTTGACTTVTCPYYRGAYPQCRW